MFFSFFFSSVVYVEINQNDVWNDFKERGEVIPLRMYLGRAFRMYL